MTNFYRVLRVNRTTPLEELKPAYWERCRETHPDAGGSAADFGLVSTAYKVLIDPIQRRDWEYAYLSAAGSLGHVVCLNCFTVNRVRTIEPGQHAKCAQCRTVLEVSSAERTERYTEALKAQVGDLLLTLGAETGLLAHDAVVVGVNALRRRLRIGRRR